MGKNNKDKKVMSRILKVIKEKNLLVKFLCLLISFGLWIYVSNVENPIKQYTITNIPVQIINSDILKSDNLAIVPNQTFTISLTIQGSSSNIYNINKSQFTVVADLSNYALKAGTNSIPVEIMSSPDNVNIKNNGVLRININLESIIEKTMSVQSELNVTTSDDTYVKDISFSTPNITISGPEDSVNKVAKLVVRGNITANSAKTTASFPVEAVDSSGNVVNNVTLSTTNVDTIITSESGKAVPIKVQTTGGLKKGLTLESIVANPNTVKIIGKQSDLNNIDEVLSEPIDLSSITGDETIITSVITPDNIALLPNEKKIEVQVKTNSSSDSSNNEVGNIEENTRTFELPVSVVGSLNGYNVNLSNDTVTVILRGTEEELNNIEPSDLSCEIDISKLTEEGGSVTPTITNTNSNVTIESENPQTISVTFTKVDG